MVWSFQQCAKTATTKSNVISSYCFEIILRYKIRAAQPAVSQNSQIHPTLCKDMPTKLQLNLSFSTQWTPLKIKLIFLPDFQRHVRAMYFCYALFARAQDAWTCWPPTATSPSWPPSPS